MDFTRTHSELPNQPIVHWDAILSHQSWYCIAGAEEVEKCPSLVKGHMAHGLVATITTTGKTGEKKKYYVVEVMEPSRPQLLAFCLSVLIFQSFSRLNL